MSDRSARAAPGIAACLICLAVPVGAHAQDAEPSGTGVGVADTAASDTSVTLRPRIGSDVPFATSLDPGFAAGDLNERLTQAALGNTDEPQPDWSFTPGISLDQEYDSTLSGGYAGAGPSGRAGAVLVTTVQPSIDVSRTTSRLQFNLSYAPAVRIVEGGGHDNGGDRVTQTFNAHMLATLLPQTAFVDLLAYGSEQPRFGGSGPSDTTTLSSDAATQNYSFVVAPYVLHRFEGIGTAELGYRFQRTLQDSATLTAASAPAALPIAALNEIGNQDATTRNEHLSFTTGEDFGRYNGAALATASDYSGSGVLDNAHRRVFSLDSGYAITRTVTALVRVGYEDIAYSGTAPVRIQDAIWDVGVRLTPSETSSLSLRYGHHDGFNALSFDASASPTARTRLFGQYSAGLSTPIEELQNALASSDIDAPGDPVDHSTGVPVYVANDVSGTEAGLYKLRRLSFGGQWLLDRDVISLSFNWDDRTLVSAPFAGAAAAGAVGSNAQKAATLSWSREISPDLSGVASAEYSLGDGLPGTAGLQGARGQTRTLVASISCNYQFSDTLSATALYSYTDTRQPAVFQLGGSAGGQHRILIGLRKSF